MRANLYFYLNMASDGDTYHNLQPSGHEADDRKQSILDDIQQYVSSEDLSVYWTNQRRYKSILSKRIIPLM